MRRLYIAVVVFLLLWIPLAYISHLAGIFIRAQQLPTPVQEDQPAESPEPSLITFMLLGVDAHDMEQPRASVRSDVIMVGTINIHDKQIRLLSIPRDTYVEIPGRGMDKINHAFAFGGGTRKNTGVWLTEATVCSFLGLERIDYHVLVDMNSVPKLVDAIGGVEIDVEIRSTLPKGKHVLNGRQAITYLRWRYGDPMGDVGRVARQQEFLYALLDRLNQLDVGPETLQLARFALSEVKTNARLEDVMMLAGSLRGIGLQKIDLFIVPGWFMNLDGISYWRPDLDKLKPIIDKVFHPAPKA